MTHQDDSIATLRNLGPVSAGWLEEVGITTVAQLKQLGPAVAYSIVRRQQPKVSLNLLWGLAAAMADKDWRELTDEEKQELLDQVE